jgi:hypothetical protein
LVEANCVRLFFLLHATMTLTGETRVVLSILYYENRSFHRISIIFFGCRLIGEKKDLYYYTNIRIRILAQISCFIKRNYVKMFIWIIKFYSKIL